MKFCKIGSKNMQFDVEAQSTDADASCTGQVDEGSRISKARVAVNVVLGLIRPAYPIRNQSVPGYSS
jgi:hypothetical protein